MAETSYNAMQDRRMESLAKQLYNTKKVTPENLAEILSWLILTAIDQKRAMASVTNFLWDRETISELIDSRMSDQSKTIKEWVESRLTNRERSERLANNGKKPAKAVSRLAQIGITKLALLVAALGLIAAIIIVGGGNILQAVIGLLK